MYLLSIWLGNKYMKNRPALSLRSILTLYNLGITLLSMYMLVEVSAGAARLAPTVGRHPERPEVALSAVLYHLETLFQLSIVFLPRAPEACFQPEFFFSRFRPISLVLGLVAI